MPKKKPAPNSFSSFLPSPSLPQKQEVGKPKAGEILLHLLDYLPPKRSRSLREKNLTVWPRATSAVAPIASGMEERKRQEVPLSLSNGEGGRPKEI